MRTPECLWDAHAELGEGPVWSVKEQALYWVDILGRRLHRYSASEPQLSWDFDEEISSVAERDDADGLIVTLRSGFAFFSPSTGSLERLVQPESELSPNRFNDGKCDCRGRYWAGTMDFEGKQPSGALYRLEHDLSCKKMDSGYAITNGPAWNADYTTMYFNDSANARVYAFDFDVETGEPSNKRLFLAFSQEDGVPDGMTSDAEGGLWIAHWGASKLTRHDSEGNVLQTIELPCSQVTSCTFGGPRLTTMFITTAAVGLSDEQKQREPLAGGLFALDLNIAGAPANTFRMKGKTA